MAHFSNFSHFILKETSNAKSELVLLERVPRFCLRPVLYDRNFANIFFIAKYNFIYYWLLMPNLVSFYAKLNEI